MPSHEKLNKTAPLPPEYLRLEKLSLRVGKISLALFCLLLCSSLLTSRPEYGGYPEITITCAKQDLDVLRNAVNLYNCQNPPLTGTSLKPLVGRYLQELPHDAWGNPYLIDTRAGFICSYGSDKKAGGEDGAADHYVYYKPRPLVSMNRQRNKLTLTLDEPIEVQPTQLLEIILFKHCRSWLQGDHMSLAQINHHFNHQWSVEHTPSSTKDSPHALTITCSEAVPHEQYRYEDLEPSAKTPRTRIQLKGIRIKPLAGGPLDATIYGNETQKYCLTTELEIPRERNETGRLTLGELILPKAF